MFGIGGLKTQPPRHDVEGPVAMDQSRDASSAAPLATSRDLRCYKFCASQPLPVVDLSRSLAQRLASPRVYRLSVVIMSRYFHHFVMIYRIGVLVFAGLLFLPRGNTRTILALSTIPCTLCLVSTALFVSLEVLQLLAQCYEFWFLVVINAVNWILLAFILDDVRALLCFSAWLAFQTVIMIDSNYRTYPTALSSTMLSSPLVAIIAVLVAAKQIRDAHYFELTIDTNRLGDASDLISFTTSTLVFFLVRIVVLKKTRIHRTFRGFRSIPCVVIRSTLRLVPVEVARSSHHRDGITVSTTRLTRPHTQRLALSLLPMVAIDPRKTVLPCKYWRNVPSWIPTHARRIRQLFYTIGAIALAMLSLHTMFTFYRDWESSKVSTSTSPMEFGAVSGRASRVVVVVSSLLSVVFCGSFVLFYQRELLRLLFLNFDFHFSAVQVMVFTLCHCDLHRWNFDRTVGLFTWVVWVFWALTLDALTPNVKYQVFRFQKRFAAPVFGSVIAGSAAIGLFIGFIPGLGLRDRVLMSFRFSNEAVFSVRTESLLLGRVVTIILWCTRQAFLLVTRKDDELNLIRGSVEYVSPFGTFPKVRTATIAAVNEFPSRRFASVVPTTALIKCIVSRANRVGTHLDPKQSRNAT